MKKVIFPLLAVAAGVSGANALEFKQYAYAGMSGVFSGSVNAESVGEDYPKMSIDTKMSFGGRLAYGVKLNDFRIELAGGIYTSQQPDLPNDADVELDVYNKSVHLNGYFDLKPYGFVTPYVGVGVGYNSVKVEAGPFNKTLGGIGVNLMAGVSFGVMENLSVDAGYRYNYSGTDKMVFDHENAEVSLHSHEINVGARYMF